MKILFTVEFYEPQKGGAEEVVRQLAERLSQKGHLVTVATTLIPSRTKKVINSVNIEGFNITGNLIRGIRGDSREIERYQNFLMGDFDIIVNYATQIWTTDLAFEILEEIKAKKILVSCCYTLKNDRYRDYFRNMPKYLNLYEKIVYLSPKHQDLAFADMVDLKTKSVIIPNGASDEEFLAEDHFDIRKMLGITTKHLIICVSNHYLAKGHHFVIDAFKKMNRKDTTLLIIGEIPSFGFKKIGHLLMGCYKHCLWNGLFNRYIKITSGQNRKLVVAAYKQASLFFFGSKIECAPLVMYESFASKTPFITTDVGNVKDHLGYLKIVHTPEEMARIGNNFLNNENEKVKLTSQAFELWKKNHTWKHIVDEYEKLFILCLK